MSNSKDKIPNKQLSDDEAFIQSLYDDLSKGDSGESAEHQPGKELDDKILAAAHRAVTSTPALVIKKRTWAIPVASAASVMLVFSLFFNQLNDPLFQSELSPDSNSPISKQADFTQGEAEQLMIKKESKEVASIAYAQQKTQQRQSQLQQLQLKADQKQKNKKSFSKMRAKRSLPSAGANVVADAQPALMLEPTPAFALESDLPEIIEYLTLTMYKKGLNENYTWIFIREEQEFNLIELVNSKGKKTLYKLSKREFIVKQSMKKNIKARLLQELGIH